MLLLIICMIIPMGIIYRSTIIEIYKKIREVSRYVSLGILIEYMYINMRNYISEKLETGLLHSKSRSHYDLVYYDGIHKYIVRFPKKRGPSSISRVISFYDIKDTGAGVGVNLEGKDVTDIFRTYLGPSHNFHGIPTTPKMLGMENIQIIYHNDTSERFYHDDIIKI